MSDASNVYMLPAKRIEGSRRNATWLMWYDRESKQWQWRLTIILAPAEYGGEVASEVEARAAVDRVLRASCI